jgi:hypothetical protein
MEGYDVCLNLRIIARDGEGWVAQWITMPFIPQAGLQLWMSAADVDWDRTLVVDSVVWNQHDSDVQVCLTDFNATESSQEPLAAWIQKFAAEGWEATA